MAHLGLRLQLRLPLRHQRSPLRPPLRPSPQLLVASLSQALRARTQDLAVLTHQACLARRLVSPFHLRQVHQRVHLASPSRHLPVSVDVAPLLQTVLEAAPVASPALVAEAVLLALVAAEPLLLVAVLHVQVAVVPAVLVVAVTTVAHHVVAAVVVVVHSRNCVL